MSIPMFDYQIDYQCPELEKVQKGYYFVPKNLRLVRITHDGSCKTYNVHGQYMQGLTDIPCEGNLSNIWTSSDAVLSWAIQQGFTDIKYLSCFFQGQNVPHFEIDTKTGEKLK